MYLMLLTISLLFHMHLLDSLPIATSPSSLAELLYIYYIHLVSYMSSGLDHSVNDALNKQAVSNSL